MSSIAGWARVRRNDRAVLGATLGGLVVLAWLALFAWGRSPYARYLAHGSLADVDGPALVALFVGGWMLMIVAMMLPTSYPLVAHFHVVTRARPDRRGLRLLLLVGYLLVWGAFGVAAYAGDYALHHSAAGGWLDQRAWILGSGVLMVAGAYQFSGLKYRCLQQCRSPRLFLIRHWRGTAPRLAALRLGAHHGVFCVGCCWSLMLVMFAVGAGNVAWMLILGAVMAVEKNASWGRDIGRPLGGLLLGCAGTVLLTQVL